MAVAITFIQGGAKIYSKTDKVREREATIFFQGGLIMKLNKIFLAAFLAVTALYFTTSQDVFAQNMFIRGDANCDGVVDGADLTYLTAFIFPGGPAPPCMDAADLNDNGAVTAIDAIFLSNFLNSGGPPPLPPYPLCGSDPTADTVSCASLCCPNHFKAYSVTPKLVNINVLIKDQFMEGPYLLQARVLLSNPVQKDTFNISDTTHHLSWYFAGGKDTLIRLNYENQFETTTVDIDSVRFLLVPTQKFPHAPPESLDHYKCYRIMQQQWLYRNPFMVDQFTSERADSLRRGLFCAPCQKTFGPIPPGPVIDTITHYVAYLIAPGQPLPFPFTVQAQDQFATWVDTVLGSKYLLVPTIKHLPPPPPDTGKNHYKAWRVTPMTLGVKRQVKDQFMTDSLFLQQLEFLSNPVKKIIFGHVISPIVDPDDHLTWYRATGRDTLLRVEYVNQFESTTVEIDSVNYLLVPAQKDGHPPFDSLDHYKAYRIINPQPFDPLAQLEDQFDRSMGIVESLFSVEVLPVFFLTPCQKWNPTGPEPTYDTTTHYVAYLIPPTNYIGPPRQVTDQFLFQRTVDVFNSQFLLVPTRKKSVSQPTENCCFPVSGGFCGPVPVGTCVPSGGVVVPTCLGDGNGNGIDDACDPVTPPDTLRNHFKTWRIFTPQVVDTFALVRDQFTIHDFLFVDSIDFLSNPVRKVVFGAAQNDTSDITRPDDHLTWYRVKSSNNRRINVQVTYVNQFESTKVFIDTVKYFLLPTQKLFPSHNPPDTLLGHYTAYRIHKPKAIKPPVELLDQFDVLFGTPERLDSLKPVYFFTPADKDNELRPKSDTHYVAYEIFPKTFPPGLTTQTIDQWGLHGLQVRNSEYLLVPSRKDTFVVCTHKPNDCNGSGNVDLADIICDVNVVFKGFPKPVPNCRCDSNCDNACTLVDIVYKRNYVFGGGPQPVPCKECCRPLP